MSQTDLLDWTPPDRHRDGETYEPRFDYERLNRQQRAVWEAVKGGGWFTLRGIADATGEPEASISARLRDFRKMGLTVDRERVPGEFGLFRYRVRVDLSSKSHS